MLALRQQNPWPDNPIQYLHDYFGNYRDPSWDEIEEKKAQIGEIEGTHIPQLQQQLEEL